MRLVLALFGFPLLMAAAVLEGTVVDERTGAPLGAVMVEVAGRAQPRGVRTDERGGFRIDDLASGVYSITASKFGYREVRPRGQLGRRRVEVGPDGARVDLAMRPLARLTGAVWLGRDRPARGALVELRRAGAGGGEVTAADSAGRFVFQQIDPGAYVLSARLAAGTPPPPPADDRALGWVGTYYPSTPDPSAAARIRVESGVDRAALDIQMESAAVSRVAGTLVHRNGDVAPGVAVELAPAGELQPRPFTLRAKSGPAGEFEFPAVPGGRWLLTAHAAAGGDAWMAQTVADHAVEGIRLRLVPRFDVPGQVVREAGAERRETDIALLVTLVPRDGGGTATARVASDGTFRLAGVQPGEYRVDVLRARQSRRTYLASLQMGGRDVQGEFFELVSAPAPLRVVLRGDGGVVRGAVEHGEGSTVLLVPQEARLQPASESRTAPCTAGGQFQVENVRPGEYYAFALEELPGPLGYGIFAEQSTINQAAAVTVRPGETSTVSLVVRLLNAE